MALQQINLGTAPEGRDGDTQRTANQKMNANMLETERRLKTLEDTSSNITDGTKALAKSGLQAAVNSEGQNKQGGWLQSLYTEKAKQFAMFIENHSNINYRGVLTLSDGSWKRWHFENNGNAVATNGSWTSSSDVRRKSDVKPLDGVLAKLESIQPISYTMDGQASVGYSAQEVQAQFPQVVFDIGDGIDKDGQEIKNTLAMNYGAMAAVNSQAIKELLEIIKHLQKRIAVLEKKVKA